MQQWGYITQVLGQSFMVKDAKHCHIYLNFKMSAATYFQNSFDKHHEVDTTLHIRAWANFMARTEMQHIKAYANFMVRMQNIILACLSKHNSEVCKTSQGLGKLHARGCNTSYRAWPNFELRIGTHQGLSKLMTATHYIRDWANLMVRDETHHIRAWAKLHWEDCNPSH